MKRAQFVPAARLEFLAEIVFYDEVEPGLGARFARAVEEATARALAFPEAGSSARSSSTRRVLLKGFPFSLIYRTNEGGIVIFAVAHQKRKPGYWHARLPAG